LANLATDLHDGGHRRKCDLPCPIGGAPQHKRADRVRPHSAQQHNTCFLTRPKCRLIQEPADHTHILAVAVQIAKDQTGGHFGLLGGTQCHVQPFGHGHKATTIRSQCRHRLCCDSPVVL
jgi:hypothetical protein